MESSVLSSAASSAPARRQTFLTALGDASNEIRYLIMRTARLVLAIVMEVVMFAAVVPATFCAFCSAFYFASFGTEKFTTANPWRLVDWLSFGGHPVIGAVILVPLVIVLYVQVMAVGMPYRYETTVPGLRTKKCWRCDEEIPDEMHCPKCKAFRAGRLLTGAAWGCSAVVTAAFAVNDLMLAVLAVVGLARGGKR